MKETMIAGKPYILDASKNCPECESKLIHKISIRYKCNECGILWDLDLQKGEVIVWLNPSNSNKIGEEIK